MAKAKAVRSLTEYVRDQRIAECPICGLPDEIRTQMQVASEKKIKRRIVLEWLREEQGTAFTTDQLNRHYNGHHEERRDAS